MGKDNREPKGLPITGDRIDSLSGERITTAVQRGRERDVVVEMRSVDNVVTRITRRFPHGFSQTSGSNGPLLRLNVGTSRTGEPILLVPTKLR